ncbi:conserved hypothetical protein [Theileria equi strain WA]|uniref:Uncharacterized protein n=1 Tax=Theileria equi strain WA TaxID=1537102 RepID=L1LFS3_THEEQ|nr:conserved hypothetical protein [Theileria equi strain WA]EKX74206.1 conserved hypothetical protein [Theileria equi strain WA]|eukprot:XP_004833658.1 conserved hypothetical protein [Theileria equi strain WA]
MNYDEKVIQGFGSVTCTDKLLFLGHYGPSSKVSIFKFLENETQDIKFVGSLFPIIGTVVKLLINAEKGTLVCGTNAGYLYIWDISNETIETLESLTYSPLYGDGYIPLNSRVAPVAVVEPSNMGNLVDFDFIYQNNFIIGLEKWPELNVNFYNASNGSKVASSRNLVKNVDKNKYMTCVKADPNFISNDGKGQWVVCGSARGTISLTLVPPNVLNEEGKTVELCCFTFDLAESVNINSLAWRFRSPSSTNLTVLSGCSDGYIRCCVFSTQSDSPVLHKQATYSYSKSSITGTVNKIICGKDTRTGVPYVIGSCNMISEFGSTEAGDVSSSCAFELVYQKLLQDSSDDIISFASIQDYITNMCVSPDHKFVVLVSSNDSVYLCPENTNASGTATSPWKKPLKLTWRTPEFVKFINN